MRRLWVGFIMTLSSFSGIAQGGIKGKVTDLQTGEALHSATVSTGMQTVQTNGKGEFELSPTTGIISLTITCIGYEKRTIPVADRHNYLRIQLSATSMSLNEVVVTGYESNRKLLETSGAVALVTRNELDRNSNVSLQPALSSIPGVQMDQSHSEDARISIRGVGITSTFGIRNLKLYINDIPLTEPNGFTRVEGLDVSTLGRIEVIKGPASSIYGAALGGVLLFQSEKAPYHQTSVEQSVLAGSYGLFRTSTTIKAGTDNSNIVATYGYQNLDGYRQWSADKRSFFSAFGQFFPNERQTVSFFVNHSEQKTHIPGALDSLQFASTPRKADSTALALKEGRYQNWTRIGISHAYRFSDNFSNVTSVNLNFYSLDHPLDYTYIRGTDQNFGGRTHFIYSPDLGAIKSKFIAGAEYLNGLYLTRNYANNAGTEGAIWQDQEITAIQYSIFAQAELTFPKAFLLTAGASNSSQEYRLRDLLKSNGVDYSGNKKFNRQISPRIALTKVFKEKYAVYATISSAFAPPVDYEISLPSGGINKNIEAVKGINYEIGTRGDLLKKNLHYDLAVYDLQLSNELIPQSAGNDQTIYVNAGKTRHQGLELALSYLLVNDEKKIVSLLKPYLAYTYNNFSFKKYVLDGRDYSGNKLTGIAPNLINAGIDAQSAYGIYLNASWYYQDKLPMTDDNTAFNKGYAVLNARIGFKRTIKHIGFDVYAGINNALDTKYASYIELNARSYSPGTLPKFYNPSMGKNYYSGISLKYIL